MSFLIWFEMEIAEDKMIFLNNLENSSGGIQFFSDNQRFSAHMQASEKKSITKLSGCKEPVVISILFFIIGRIHSEKCSEKEFWPVIFSALR